MNFRSGGDPPKKDFKELRKIIEDHNGALARLRLHGRVEQTRSHDGSQMAQMLREQKRLERIFP